MLILFLILLLILILVRILILDEYRRCRYLERALRENVGFKGTPIKILLRGKAVVGTKAQAGTNEQGRVGPPRSSA